MSTTLTEDWLHSVATSTRLPAFHPSIAKELLPAIETHIRKIAQQAHKFQRRGKRSMLTVEDINLALSLNGKERIYGLVSVASVGAKSQSQKESQRINLLELAKSPLPPPDSVPLIPSIHLHWLAIDGVQPSIPENPLVKNSWKASVGAPDVGDSTFQALSKEMKVLAPLHFTEHVFRLARLKF